MDDYIESMAREHAEDAPEHTPASKTSPQCPVKGEHVTFSRHDYHAYLSKHAQCSPTFTMLIIHEWWGLNAQMRSMADQIAGMGGVAFAVDLYQTNAATEPKQARKLMKKAQIDEDNLLEHLKEACIYLEKEFLDLKRGVIGWCFGGTWSLQISLHYSMDATIVYYGNLTTDAAKLAGLHGRLLGIFGQLDKGIKLETVKAFELALEEAEKKHEICIYEGAEHAFANPSGKFYNAVAATQAWKKTLSFMSEIFDLKG
mmetsp:Transcript_19165/g.28370  ORF Transcript_19165/g.28370 Transcript_19165/m.28370 type:complete len:257 (+) Transcript_19165:85-855(+)|eukprot:CAMPEP_0194253256 /NCGR_PEP_ID=MMETSP0158-20130606/29485_1 /TAXON_ID=33649 /ORGANISM="Thalassionema nitzschioides, Strain L26-B" /LENGTH=256 /DNA_ID=CAMNT_0038990897 /DNA_START=21 /DNA_END=791 /DNA_ORIENTATION=+